MTFSEDINEEHIEEDNDNNVSLDDVYEAPEDILCNAAATIMSLLNDLRVHGIYGVVSIGVYDVMNDTDLYDINWSGSCVACKGIASIAIDRIDDQMRQSTSIIIDDGDGFQEVDA